MTRHALRVIVGSVLFDCLVRVVASRAAYPAIIRIAFAVKDSIRLEPDVVDLHPLER